MDSGVRRLDQIIFTILTSLVTFYIEHAEHNIIKLCSKLQAMLNLNIPTKLVHIQKLANQSM